MIDGMILLAVHAAKVAILALVGLVPHVTDAPCLGVRCDPGEVRAPVPAVVITTGEAGAALGVQVPAGTVEAAIAAADHAARIRQLVPPVRVEIAFPPDLLHPPEKSLTL
jgi:hypothetical protein